MTQLDVALCQYGLGEAASLEEFQGVAATLFERAGDADVYALPELCLSDIRLRGEDTPTGETALGPGEVDTYHDFLLTEAADRDAVIVGGSYNVVIEGEPDGAGDVVLDGSDWTPESAHPMVNRAPIATPEGLTTYDKIHPTPNERDQGKSCGTGEPVVVDHRGVGVGVLVCYDVEFPELAREAAAAGAELLVVPSWTSGDAGAERVSRCASARAIENQYYVASIPLVGERGDTGGVGASTLFAPCDDVCGPHGTRLQLARNECMAATGTVDIEALRESRENAEVRPYSDYLAGN